jgi:polysaccharide biosynthesis protein PslE
MSAKNYETPKREVLVFYYKYRARLVLAFLLPFLLAVTISFIPKPRYEATSTLVVRLGSEYVYQPESGTGSASPTTPIPFDKDQIYKAEVAILSSHDLHQQVVQTVGLDRMYPQNQSGGHRLLTPLRDQALDLLDKWYPVDEETPSLVESVRTDLVDYDSDTKLSEDEKAHRRLDMAVENFGKRLDIVLGKDSAVINVSYQHRNREVAIEALDDLLKFYMDKRKQLYLDSRGSLARDEADSKRRRAANALSAVENFKRDNQIYSMNDQRAQLLTQREDVRKQMLTVSNLALEDKLRDLTTQLEKLDSLTREYESLEHDLQMANDEYTLYTHKLDEAQTYDDMEKARAGSVRIIQPPAAPPEPKRLQGLILIAGFILSLIFTILVAAITEFSRSGFLTPERLERNIGLPVLGVLTLRK